MNMLYAAPCLLELPVEEQDALQERLIMAEDLPDLSEADRALLQKATFEVAAGKSSTFQHASEWGNWEMIDAAVDAEDEEALEVALDTVGRGYGYFPGAPEGSEDGDVDLDVEPALDDEGNPTDAGAKAIGELEVKDLVPESWVGL
jgi:hypothetical protein